MVDSTVRVQKLNGENYSTWSFKLKLLLIKEGTWTIVTTAPKADDLAKADWMKGDEAAQVTIGLLVEDNQLGLIKKHSTSYAQWKALKEYHQKATLSNKIHLYKRLFRTVLDENGDMEMHIAKLSDYVDRLSGLGQTLEDEIFASILLSSLPESYNTLVTAL